MQSLLNNMLSDAAGHFCGFKCIYKVCDLETAGEGTGGKEGGGRAGGWV